MNLGGTATYVPSVGFCSVSGFISCLFVSILEGETPFYLSPLQRSRIILGSAVFPHLTTEPTLLQKGPSVFGLGVNYSGM